MVRLFDVQNGNVIPTEHCYTLKFLKDIMSQYPLNHMKVYTYLFYMTCPNPDQNPFFHYRDVDKEEAILEQLDADFSSEDDEIQLALRLCQKMYETETSRAYNGIKKALDNLADYMAKTSITDGRDGNISQIANVAKNFDAIRQTYKGVFRDLIEEQQSSVRGGQNLAYDDM
jgi:hypothetical protein